VTTQSLPKENQWIQFFCSGIVIMFFLVGIVHHALPFAGVVHDTRSELWHGFNSALALSGIFSVFSARKAGWAWLITIFLSQIAIEARGTWMTVGAPEFGSQLIETLLNALCLLCIFVTKRRYFSTPNIIA
jgi:hypothetical protein